MYRQNKTHINLSKILLGSALLFVGLLAISCNEHARGFAFPEGDIAEGKSIYTKLNCNECHSISEIDWKGGNDNLQVQLGGEVSAMKSYGDLVTSVINPSHKIAKSYKKTYGTESAISKMTNYNEVMTVQELIDLVAFLQSKYKIKTPPTDYRPYLY